MFLLTGLVFFAILSLLVIIHEFGHFIVARIIGVTVEEFGLGLPPRIWGRKIKGTIYSINWLPIGGFVRLAGEDNEEAEMHKIHGREKIKHYFWARTKKERSLILLAGVTMNFLLAVAVTTFLLTYGVMEPSGKVFVQRVSPESPAQISGIKLNDQIEAIYIDAQNKVQVKIPEDVINYTNAHKGEKVNLIIIRDNQTETISLIPRKVVPAGQGPMGVAVSDLTKRYYSIKDAPLKALEITLIRAKDMLVGLGMLIWRLVTFQKLQADVAGPIGIAQATGEAVKFGFLAVLEFMSILSLNLAVLNILPIPALDGGRLLFVFIEKIIGRKVRPAFEKQTHQIGMIILFALILLVSLNDILRLLHG